MVSLVHLPLVQQYKGAYIPSSMQTAGSPNVPADDIPGTPALDQLGYPSCSNDRTHSCGPDSPQV